MNLLEMTRDLVTAQIRRGNVDAESVNDWLRDTHSTLLNMWQREQAPRDASMAIPIDWRTSIKPSSITCLECGKVLRQLAPLHLNRHGLSAGAYRAKHRMPPSQPLSAKELTRRRREVMLSRRVWEKGGRPRKGKGA